MTKPNQSLDSRGGQTTASKENVENVEIAEIEAIAKREVTAKTEICSEVVSNKKADPKSVSFRIDQKKSSRSILLTQNLISASFT